MKRTQRETYYTDFIRPIYISDKSLFYLNMYVRCPRADRFVLIHSTNIVRYRDIIINIEIKRLLSIIIIITIIIIIIIMIRRTLLSSAWTLNRRRPDCP